MQSKIKHLVRTISDRASADAVEEEINQLLADDWELFHTQHIGFEAAGNQRGSHNVFYVLVKYDYQSDVVVEETA